MIVFRMDFNNFFGFLYLCTVATCMGNAMNGRASVFHMNQGFEPTLNDSPQCTVSSDADRFDCFPGANANQAECEKRGCCWKAASDEVKSTDSGRLGRVIDTPYCYFPTNYISYTAGDVHETEYGLSAPLTLQTQSAWPDDVAELKLDVYMERMGLRFRITDAKRDRFEVPIDTPQLPTKKAEQTDYNVSVNKNPFGIKITRKSTGAVLFNSAIAGAPLIYADQFLQISTQLPNGLFYGLGEHRNNLLRNLTAGNGRRQINMWAHDANPIAHNNLYGVHPFYLAFEEDGKTHGIFLLNSNAMDIDLQPLPALTFRTIGGILDFFVFLGPSPDDVIQQYASVIGKPQMPPYWALGFHLCRYGYGTSENLKEVIARNRAINIPYEVQWNDIDYMDRFLDWTYDPERYKGLPDIVKDLHDNDQKYIIIIDPGISSAYPGKYPPYDEGLKQDIFVRNVTDQILIGKVWPGITAFPDFSNPASHDWWYDQAKRYHDEVPFDGLWTDMNEPSNFVTGTLEGCVKDNKYDYPPYTPGIVAGLLEANTICPSAKQHLSNHYNLHSMYGHFEVIATNNALEKILEKRSIVISRSTFPSTGHHGGHWTGDVFANFAELYFSIPALLEFQMYGIPLVGADICGFAGTTTEELCIRWMQLGAFYPFMRNHNDLDSKDQDPAVFSKKAQDIMRDVLELRYSFLPYLYSLFYATHITGRPHVMRPLSFQFPNDKTTYAIDQQFLWGKSLLISPALQEGQTVVHAYFPNATWYDLYTSMPILGPIWKDLDTPLDDINIHVKGGAIIPLQDPDLTTVQSRQNPFDLIVALDQNGNAQSEIPLNWDDGETLEAFEKKMVTMIWFEVSNSTLKSNPIVRYRPQGGMPLRGIRIMGVSIEPKNVNVNGKAAKFTYSQPRKELMVAANADLLSKLNVLWS